MTQITLCHLPLCDERLSCPLQSGCLCCQPASQLISVGHRCIKKPAQRFNRTERSVQNTKRSGGNITFSNVSIVTTANLLKIQEIVNETLCMNQGSCEDPLIHS